MIKHLNNSVTRRGTLARLMGAGAAAWFIPAWNETVEAADTCVLATPTVTEGPYWVDEKLFRSDIRTDPSTGVARAGTPLTLTITVQSLSSGSCAPLAGAYVDIWHCDAKGIYSDESTYNPGGGTGSVNTSGQKFLRGYQVTDALGQVTFTTIFPGWYSGRTIHIHFRVRTYSGTAVVGNFVSQIFFDDAVNNVVLAQSAYSRTSARDTQNSNDMVYQTANKERMLATVSGSNAAGYTAALTAGVTISAPVLGKPSISAGGVVNAVGGAAGIAPGSWISIYGSNLALAARTLASADLVNNTIPASLGGVTVQIDGKTAFPGYVSPTQLNVLVPADAGTGSVVVTVTNSGGAATLTTTSQSVLPGLSALGKYVRAVRYPDGAIVNGTGTAEPGYPVSASVGQGDVVSLYGTGFGPVSTTVASGLVFAGAYPTSNPVTVTIGGISAEVLWAGLVGAGLYQINVRVPSGTPDGDQAVVATVSGLSSQSGATLKVAAAAKLAFNIVARRLLAQRGGRPPLTARDRRHLAALAGLTGPVRFADGGGPMARMSLQAAERQGGMIQVA